MALFAEGQLGAYSTRSRKLSQTPGLGGLSCSGVLLWGPAAATCFPRTESSHLRPPLLLSAWGALSRTQGGQRPWLLCSRSEVNEHSLQFPLKAVY